MRIAITTAFVAVFVSPILLLAVERQKSPDAKTKDPIFPRTYNVSDLPVWRKTGTDTNEFAPEVVIRLLQSTVSPDSWKAGAEIRPFPTTVSLVIAQTQANHDEIAEVLETFRKFEKREVRELRTEQPSKAANR